MLSHLGGALPALVGRIGDGDRVFRSPQTKSRYFKMMYLDGASFYKPALRCALDFWGPDKILLGSDYPYGWVDELSRCIKVMEQFDLEGNEIEMVLNRNATRILRL